MAGIPGVRFHYSGWVDQRKLTARIWTKSNPMHSSSSKFEFSCSLYGKGLEGRNHCVGLSTIQKAIGMRFEVFCSSNSEIDSFPKCLNLDLVYELWQRVRLSALWSTTRQKSFSREIRRLEAFFNVTKLSNFHLSVALEVSRRVGGE